MIVLSVLTPSALHPKVLGCREERMMWQGDRGGVGVGGSTPAALQHSCTNLVSKFFFYYYCPRSFIVLSWEQTSIITPPAPNGGSGEVQVWWALITTQLLGVGGLKNKNTNAYKYTIRCKALEETCAREGP